MKISSEGAQIARFGMVGILATSVHGASFLVLVETLQVRAVAASVGAFLIAFIVSYGGHRHWTFKARSGDTRGSLVKFAATALLGLFVSAGTTYLIVGILAANYLYALVLVVVAVPVATYLLSKMWVFAQVEEHA
jgi:putative flippase GtrA